jgi:hypothetical protein
VDIGQLPELAGAQAITVAAWIKWASNSNARPAIVGKFLKQFANS